MAWRYEVMEATRRQPMLEVLDRCGRTPVEGPDVFQYDEEVAIAVLDLRRFGFYLFDGTGQRGKPRSWVRVSQNDWHFTGTMTKCCEQIASRHPTEEG